MKMRKILRALILSLACTTWLAAIQGQVLTRGDMAIIGINANNGGCSGVSAEDEISFICFKAIAFNTRIWLTDKGYEYQNPGFWGTVNEGVIELRRSGGVLAAGTITTLRINGGGTVTSVSAGWTATTIVAGMNLNSNGEQVFIFQANVGSSFTGTGNNGVFNNCELLYGFSTRPPATAWVSFQNDTQYSGLPPGMICFSMSPAVGSDFLKYVAPLPDVFPALTFRTQRQWIIEIDDQARWVNQGNCATYNTSGATSPNYAGGGVFPIAAGGFINGVWTGAKGIDWFDCRNWDDAEVPIATSNVVINNANAPINSPTIGVTASPPTAVCATLSMSTAGASRNLTIQNSGVLQVGGAVNITNAVGSVAAFNGVIISSGSMTVGGNVALSGTGAQRGGIRNEVPAPGNMLQINANLTINTGGVLDLEGAGVGGTMGITGNYTNNVDANAFDELNSMVNFNGAGQQYITTLGDFQENFQSMGVVKTSNDLNLNSPIFVRGQLNLSNGRMMTSATDILTVGNTSSIAGPASNNSFVHGPMVKVGPVGVFQFPVGKASALHGIGISAITAAATDAFIAEYFPQNPQTDIGSTIETPPLFNISSCEYWKLDRYAGTPSARVTLGWNTTTNCGIASLPALRVARWDGTMWRDRGGPGTGTLALGSVTTSIDPQETVFSPDGWWTFASLTDENPLPVELLSFNAWPDGKEVALAWATASEQDNDYFTVERSADGLTFADILRVDGAGNSIQRLDYTDVDPWPLNGWNYYRLRQTDFDGATTTSAIVPVRMAFGTNAGLTLSQTTDLLFASHDFPVGSHAEVVDMTGRVLGITRVEQDGRHTIALDALAPGTYMLRLTDGERQASAAFVR